MKPWDAFLICFRRPKNNTFDGKSGHLQTVFFYNKTLFQTRLQDKFLPVLWRQTAILKNIFDSKSRRFHLIF